MPELIPITYIRSAPPPGTSSDLKLNKRPPEGGPCRRGSNEKPLQIKGLVVGPMPHFEAEGIARRDSTVRPVDRYAAARLPDQRPRPPPSRPKSDQPSLPV